MKSAEFTKIINDLMYAQGWNDTTVLNLILYQMFSDNEVVSRKNIVTYLEEVAANENYNG